MTSMYGISIDLPAGWVDITEYGFEAPSSPIPKLLFTRESLAGSEVDAWLEELREKVGALELRAQPVVTFDNPSLWIRGFDALLDKGGERAGTSFIVVSLPTHAIIVQPHWVDGAQPLVRNLVKSFRLRSPNARLASSSPSLFCYAVYELLFDSSIPFEQPWSFAFESEDGRCRLWCSGRPREPAFQAPHFRSLFDIDARASVSEPVHSESFIVSPHVLAPDATGPLFEEQRWVTTVSGIDGTHQQLAWAEARTNVNARPFRFWFAAQGDSQTATTTWSALLNSAKRD